MKNLNFPKKTIFLLVLSLLFINSHVLIGQSKSEPLKVGIIGLSHGHVHLLLRRPDKGDIKIVGIVESNKELAQRLSKYYGYSMNIVFNTIEEMVAASEPDAVTAFGSTFDHLKVVEKCAPLGIHVMVEKPLAVNLRHAQKMKSLARKYDIHLLTNYETTWYPSNHKTYEMVHNGKIGKLRKIVVHDGHRGPAKLDLDKEFLNWLIDPVKNGGGALTDFGCYGVNLITWLNKGERPETVTAISQTIQAELYPKVDDETTIVLRYPTMQGIIQASWNWPISRKDMEVYGERGYIYCDNKTDIRYRFNRNEDEQKDRLEKLHVPYNDPFSLFAAVVMNKVTLPPYDLSSLENNMIVIEILEAAKKSARTGKMVKLKK